MLEGGGQILRNAASLSAILQIPIHIDNIRAKRTKPGLRPQHLAGLRLVSDTLLQNARLEGGSIGSQEIKLYPGKLILYQENHHHLIADTGTAGSCMLMGQIALPCILFSSHQHNDVQCIELKGGTDAPMAPPVDYFHYILLPTLEKHLNIHATLDVQRRGFYPKGNGIVHLHATPLPPTTALPPLIMVERGAIMKCTLRAFTAGKVKESIAQRMVDSALHVIKQRMPNSNIEYITHIEHYSSPDQAFGDGCGLLIVAESERGCLFGATGLGERGVLAETVGQKAADELMDVLQVQEACVDDYLMDQLIIFMALAKGKSIVMAREPTLHARTAMAVAELMTGARFTCTAGNGGGGGGGEDNGDNDDNVAWRIECDGVGITVEEQNESH